MDEQEAKRIWRESEKIRGPHHRYRVLINKCAKELKKFKKEVFKKELDCYMNGTDECMDEVNEVFLKELDLQRKIEITRMEKAQKCWSVLPFTQRPKDEFDWDIKTSDQLSEYKKFFACSEPFYKQNLSHIQDQRDLKKEIQRRLINFKKGW